MITLSPGKMTMAEKLSAMGTFWNNLCQHSSLDPPPDWHEPVLVLREQQRIAGKQQAMDWNTAKEKIRQKIK